MRDVSFAQRPFDDIVRLALLALIFIGVVGLIVELFLIGHYDEGWQIVPLVLLGLGFFATLAVWRWPSPTTLKVFEAIMVAFIIAGLLGVWRHYAGNVEWELERHADLSGMRLFVESVRGATPILAPGALAQLGLLGFVFTFRHPAFGRQQRSTSSGDQ